MALKLPSDSRVEGLRKKLLSQPGSVSAGVEPTSSQVLTDVALREARQAKEGELKQVMKERYPSPSEVPSDATKTKGLLSRVLTVLNAPTATIAGAAEWATGTGTKKGLLENIAANVNEKGSFGDILRAKGVTNYVSAPVGFVLDVALDPLNWATAGTAALVPRVAKGLLKGGLTGAKVAAESGALLKASNTLRLVNGRYRNLLNVPAVEKAGFEGAEDIAAKAVNQASPFMRTLADATDKSRKQFVDLVEGGVDKVMQNDVSRFNMFRTMVNSVKDSAGKTSFGEKVSGLLKHVWVNSEGKYNDDIVESAAKFAEKGKDVDLSAGKLVEPKDPALAKMRIDQGKVTRADDNWTLTRDGSLNILTDVRAARDSGNSTGFLRQVGEVQATADVTFDAKFVRDFAEKYADGVNDIQAMGVLATKLGKKIDDPSVREALKGLKAHLLLDDAIKAGMADDAALASVGTRMGLRVDDPVLVAKLGDVRRGEKLDEEYRAIATAAGKGVMDEAMYERYKNMDIKEALTRVRAFKSYSAGMSGYDAFVAKHVEKLPVAKILNVYSSANFAFKLAAVGLSPVARVNQIFDNVAQTSMAGINILNPAWFQHVRWAKRLVMNGDITMMPKLFGPQWKEALIAHADVFAPIFGISPELLTLSSKWTGRMHKIISGLSGMSREAKAVATKELGLFQEVLEPSKLIKANANTMRPNSATMMGGDRAIDTAMMAKIKEWGRKATEGGPGSEAYKFLHTAATAPFDDFGKYDTMFKIGTSSFLTKAGVSEAELRRLMNWYQFTPAATLKGAEGSYVQGRAGTYLFDPVAAVGAANTIYRNYSALPDFANMMRKLPVFGAPFGAFLFSSATNYAKALGMNPAYFNRVAEMMREAGGERTPLEKEALTSKYYSFLDKEGMAKVPFFKENPVYLNLQNVFSHYSFNFLQPTERNYGDKYGDKIAKFIDTNPVFSSFMKDPVGQFIMDYGIMPSLISESLPESQFGTPLYPQGATVPEKIGLAATSLAQPFVPRVAGYAGLLPSPLPENLDTEITPYVPSFTYRSLHNAIKGRSSSGMPANESALSRTIRQILREMGVSTYTVPLEYAATEAKKNAK